MQRENRYIFEGAISQVYQRGNIVEKPPLAAASEKNTVLTNGMSYNARSGENTNSAGIFFFK